MTFDFPDFTTAHILVIGDVMLDRYGHGNASRISPEAPVPVVNVNRIEERAGGAGNVAMNIHALGAQVSLFGIVGTDEHADIIQQLLAKTGIDAHLQHTHDAPTITKLRIISHNQQLIRLDFEQSYHDIDKTSLLNKLRDHIHHANAIILSDYNKGTLSHAEAIIDLAKHANVPVLIDPKGHNFTRYRGASLLTPNLKEFETIVGPCQTHQHLIQKGQDVIQRHGLGALLITQGSKGMTLLQPQADPLHIPAIVREVYDVTGAGDTVIATLASGLASGLPLEQAAQLANLAASIVVGHLGAHTVSPSALRHALHQINGNTTGILTQQELQLMMQDTKTRTQRIVFIDGHFDTLTPKDISGLQKAKQLGDHLVVVVYPKDDSTTLAHTLSERMAALAALECVDWITSCDKEAVAPFVQTTQADVWAIRQAHPNKLPDNFAHTNIVTL